MRTALLLALLAVPLRAADPAPAPPAPPQPAPAPPPAPVPAPVISGPAVFKEHELGTYLVQSKGALDVTFPAGLKRVVVKGPGKGRETWVVTGRPGQYTLTGRDVQVVVDWEKKDSTVTLDPVEFSLLITPDTAPAPQPPQPGPSPPAPPQPDGVNPFAGTPPGLKILVVYDKDAVNALPPAQAWVVGGQFRQYVWDKCSSSLLGQNKTGEPDRRVWASDVNPAGDDPAWAKSLAAAKAANLPLPYMAVGNSKAGTVVALPKTVADAQTLCQKYEEGK